MTVFVDFTPLIIERLKTANIFHQIGASADFATYVHLKRGHYRPPLCFVIADNEYGNEPKTTDRRQFIKAHYGISMFTENRIDEYGGDSSSKMKVLQNAVAELMLSWNIQQENLACARTPYFLKSVQDFFEDDMLMRTDIYVIEYFIYPLTIGA